MTPINNKNKIMISFFGIISLGCTAFSAWDLLRYGDIVTAIKDVKTLHLLIEMVIVFSVILCLNIFIHDIGQRIVIQLFVVSFFLWAHRILLPLIVSGLYILGLILLGNVVLTGIRKKEGFYTSRGIRRISHDFISGASVYIIFICILSLLNLGDMGLIKLITVLLLIATAITYMLFNKSGVAPLYIDEEMTSDFIANIDRKGIMIAVFTALTISMFMLQAGRLNIAIDYDSLHYGLRSAYILNGGHGIYENLGMVNDVYKYAKGVEILSMPLNTDFTYGFIIAFSWWMTVGSALTIYDIVKRLSGKKAGIVSVAVFSCIPAIMNMSLSAKAEAITLMFELIFIADIVTYLSEEKSENLRDHHLLWAFIALFMTLVFEPVGLLTAVVLLISTCIYIIITKRLVLNFDSIVCRIALLPIFAVIGVLARTYILYGYLISPIDISLLDTPDITTAIMTGGTSLIIILLLVALLFKNKKSAESRFIGMELFIIITVTCSSIIFEYQPDRNQYMLLYSLVIIVGVSKLFKYTYNKLLIIVISPVIIWAVMITSATNLNHSFGLTPIDFNHIGYYDHVSDIYDSILQDGNKEIFDYLLQNNKNRVVAMANMPQCFSFRCNVQSYRDIVGDGGNPSIVTSIDSFKQFLNYAKTDYIYTEKQFLVSGSRQEELIRCMVIEGSLKEYIYEDDNVLYIYVRR